MSGFAVAAEDWESEGAAGAATHLRLVASDEPVAREVRVEVAEVIRLDAPREDAEASTDGVIYAW